MAKTFGTGADPKGLVNRGVEGSGAAQIFRPSQAVQDFVTRQARGEQQKAAQKKAEAKAKAEKQKEIDKYAIDADVATFMQKDNEEALARLGALEGRLANLKAMGIDPRNDIEFKKEEYAFNQYISNLKNEKDAYEKGVTNFIAISKDPNYEPEQIDDFAKRLEIFRQSPSGQRFETDTNPPQKPLKIDYEKAVSDVVKNVQGDKKPYVDERTGQIITTIEVPNEKITDTVNYFRTTPEYKQKTASLLKDGTFQNEEDAKEFLDENLKIRFRTQRSITKGDTGSGYGDGAASTYRAEYENIRPSDINIENYGLTPAETINMGFSKPLSATQKPYLRSIDISSSPKKAPVPLTIETNIKYRKDGKDVALTNNDLVIPNRLIEYNTLDGTTKYLFLFNIKGTGDAAAVIDSGNKKVFERYFLKQGKTIEDYLNEGEKAKNVNATPKPTAKPNTVKTPSSAPSKPTVNKFEKYKRQ
jgi:hypothetical protein